MQYALIWLAIVLGLALVGGLLRLPERMQCWSGGSSRHAHCKHGVLAPEVWRAR